MIEKIYTIENREPLNELYLFSGLGSGVDIILPSNWSMPFWLACIFRCVRVGALRESQSIAFEYGNMQSPDINDDPDTPAYAREAVKTMLELKEKYFRYPPNRRVNFTKLGISSPFFCQWKILMREWADTEDFFILRDPKLLKLLQENLPIEEVNRSYKKSSNHISALAVQNGFENRNCLIRVKVSNVQKGRPKRFAIICMPTDEDVQKFKNSNDWSGPVEKLNVDPNESIRKASRKNHLAFLKQLKRQRIRRKEALSNKLSKLLNKEVECLEYKNKTKDLLQMSREAVGKQFQKMSRLYLPECRNVRYSCDREIMGYITIGDFSLSEASGTGFGYVALNSLIEIISKKRALVLIRNSRTRQYRFAKLEILA